jgi:hypothetical protein
VHQEDIFFRFGCNTYDAFIKKMKSVSEADLHYFGMAIYGDKKND